MKNKAKILLLKILMKINLSHSFIFLFFFQVKITSIFSKIIFVFEHVRHGTRTPGFSEDSNYTDQFGTKWEGDGELTSVGKRMHFVLGIHNRLKYSSLIDFSQLNPKEINIVSTDSIRTLKSLQAQLHGMFLPGTGENLTENELLYAYPPGKEYLSDDVHKEIENLKNEALINRINIFPIRFFEAGKVFLNEPDNCPYITNYRIQLEQRMNKTLMEFMKEFDNKFGDKLKEYLYRPNKDFIYTYGSLIDITDNYICNYDNGKNLSDFLNKTGFDKEEFHEYAIKVKMFYLFNLSSDQVSGTLGGTPHMRSVINYMDKKIKNENNVTYSEPKMVIQGGHDTTVNAIQYFMYTAFGIPVQYVNFGSHIFFELHKDDNQDDKYTVKYFYESKLLLEKEYNEFKEKVLETLWSEQKVHYFCFQEENKNEEVKSSNTILILIITNIIFAISTGIFIFLFIYRRKSNISNYKINDDKLVD